MELSHQSPIIIWICWALLLMEHFLPLDLAGFATTNIRGTIVDSATTLSYLVEEAFDPSLNAHIATLEGPNHLILLTFFLVCRKGIT